MPKYARVAAIVRSQIEDGMLPPGAPVPSGAALARSTGFSILTCRHALRTLISDGVLVPGASPSARPRVAPRDPTPSDRELADAVRALSASLAGSRRAAGLTQRQLAEIVGMSLTAVGHAETGRVWQSRPFWECADKAVNAGGELLALHDAYRAAGTSSDPVTVAEEAATGETTDDPETMTVVAPEHVKHVTITWADGAVTTVHPPSSVFPPVPRSAK
ncbi:MAG: GntR family transcriptional regulator [Trebonia sp.]